MKFYIGWDFTCRNLDLSTTFVNKIKLFPRQNLKNKEVNSWDIWDRIFESWKKSRRTKVLFKNLSSYFLTFLVKQFHKLETGYLEIPYKHVSSLQTCLKPTLRISLNINNVKRISHTLTYLLTTSLSVEWYANFDWNMNENV